MVTGDYALLTFHSDFIIPKRGFEIFFTFVGKCNIKRTGSGSRRQSDPPSKQATQADKQTARQADR